MCRIAICACLLIVGSQFLGSLFLSSHGAAAQAPFPPAGPVANPLGAPAAATELAAPEPAAPESAATELTSPEDPTIVGRMEHEGWGLSGPRARHYIFGGLAVADYSWQGKRRIVTLQEQTDFPKPDPDYLYYRELRNGNWWAFRKHPWPDRTYSVWFRSAEQPGSKWQRWQLAVLQMPAK